MTATNQKIHPPGAVLPSNVWNDRATAQPRTYDRARRWYAYAETLLRESGVRDGAALDLGCGLGEFMEVLAGLGVRTRGLDGEPEQVAKLIASGLDVTVGDLESALPFDDAMFDVVSCLEVIEHIARAEALAQEIARILVPGGLAVVSTPNVAFWQNRVRSLRGREPVNEGIHLRFFTPASLRNLLSDAGLEFVRSASFGPVTGLNWLRRGLGCPDRNVVVPRWAESAFAYDLVFLCRRTAEERP